MINENKDGFIEWTQLCHNWIQEEKDIDCLGAQLLL